MPHVTGWWDICDLRNVPGRPTQHAAAVAARPPAQAHGAPCFMTFHRAWLLELEAAILSVSPSLGALP